MNCRGVLGRGWGGGGVVLEQMKNIMQKLRKMSKAWTSVNDNVSKSAYLLQLMSLTNISW